MNTSIIGQDELDRIRFLKEPPQFVFLKNGGFMTLFYDNFLAVGPDAESVHNRIKENCNAAASTSPSRKWSFSPLIECGRRASITSEPILHSRPIQKEAYA